MDFKEIKNINLNANSAPIKRKGVEKRSTQNNKKEQITKKSPNNPSYWQNTAGIKTRNISFGNKEVISEEYINQKLKQLVSNFRYGYYQESAMPTIKNGLSDVIPLGKKAVDNYSKFITKAASYNLDDEKLKHYSDGAITCVKSIPDIKDDNIDDLSYTLFLLARKPSSYVEKYKNILGEILQQDNASIEDKISWLKINFDASHIRRKDGTESPFFSNYAEDFTSRVKLSGLFSDEKTKIAALKAEIPQQTLSKLSTLTDKEEINQTDFRRTIGHNLKWLSNYPKDIPFFEKFIDTISEKEEKIPTLNRLLSRSTFVYILGSQQLNSLLNVDDNFLNKLLDKLTLKNANSSSSFLVQNPYDFQKFIEIVNDENLDDFVSETEGKEAEESIHYAHSYVNPVTGLFDKDLIGWEKEIKNTDVDIWHIKKLLFASIDKGSGKLSPIAKELVNFLYPQKQEDTFSSRVKQIKTNLKRKTIAHSNVTASLFQNDIVGLVNSLRDKKGVFQDSNLKDFYKIIRANRKENEYTPVSLNSLALIMNHIKNDEGTTDRDKLNIAIKIIKTTHSYEKTSKILDALSKFPADKYVQIYDVCNSIGTDKEIKMSNLPTYASYCFDIDGNIKQENLDYVKKLVSKKEIEYDASFFKMLENKPHIKDFILELVPHLNANMASFFVAIEIENFDSENSPISDSIKNKMIDYAKSNKSLKHFKSLYDACSKDGIFDEELFKNSLRLIDIEHKITEYNKAIHGALAANIVSKEIPLPELKFKEKVLLLDSLRNIKEHVSSEKLTGFDYLEKAISDVESSLSLDNVGLPIDKDTKLDFVNNVLASTSSQTELTTFEQKMVDSIPLLESMKSGLPLTYSRTHFLKDLSKICTTPEDISILKNKTDIIPFVAEQEGRQVITGYNGIIKLSELDLNNPKEKQIYDCMYRFMYKNSAITSDSELNKQLNYILKACPEFINCIGKKQHDTHEYTVDTHSLLVMAYSLQNPSYKKDLNALDRSLLKMTAIFHDLLKEEGTVDKGHQNLSSLYARSISKKLFSSVEKQDRLFELIDNHHWTEEYAKATDKVTKAQELAFRFRRPSDFEISKILTNSDLKAVSEHFYNKHKNCLEKDNLKLIQENLDKLYSSGNVLLTDKIATPQKLSKCVNPKDGKEYAVIDFNKIPNDTDMGNYGFSKGKKKEDLVLLVHMVDSNSIYQSLSTLKLLTSPMNGGVLSESIITPEYNRTYCDRKYGVLLSQINTNIVNEASSNQGSGYAKDFSNVINLIFSDYYADTRKNFKNSLLTILDIPQNSVSDEEYAKFYKEVLASKTSINEFPKTKEYKIGQYTVSGEKLCDAIMKHQDSLIDKEESHHNEIVGYTPKINAVIAKVPKLEDVDDELLKFANENNLPIILMQ